MQQMPLLHKEFAKELSFIHKVRLIGASAHTFLIKK